MKAALWTGGVGKTYVYSIWAAELAKRDGGLRLTVTMLSSYGHTAEERFYKAIFFDGIS
jgi:hypothetical protein